MKTISFILLIFIFFSCAKDKEPTPTNNSTNNSTPVPLPKLVLKISGLNFNYTSSYTWKINGSPSTRALVFNNSTTNEEVQFRFSTLPFAGTYTFVKNGSPSIAYIKNGFFYASTLGNLNITAIDTFANGTIHKMVGTFDCRTDTLGNAYYDLYNGTINY